MIELNLLGLTHKAIVQAIKYTSESKRKKNNNINFNYDIVHKICVQLSRYYNN